jgi:hypothetical protein
LVSFSSLLSESSVNLGSIFNTVTVNFWRLLGLNECNVLFEELTSNKLLSRAGSHLLFINVSSFTVLFLFGLYFRLNDSIIISETESRGASSRHHKSMVSNNLLSDTSVMFGILLVKHNEYQVKTGKKGIRKSNIFGCGNITGILSVNGVSSGNDRAPSVERAM